jgi:CoA:oxalate CoA-transferase
MAQDKQGPPLDGTTILDLSRVLAGPYCTLILAQLGARVIKVEMPGSGDDSRAFGPFVNGKSLYFSAINYDKQSIALNLKEPDDRAIFEGLAGIADVLVENFRPGTMERLGYGWDTLRAAYLHLIYAAASGFGDTGPYAHRAAYDLVVQGMGGIMSMTGQPDAPPTRVGVSIGDLAAGLYLAIGVLGALYKRAQGGGAVKVDVAMLDCQVAMLEDALSAYLCTGEIAQPQGSRHPEVAPFQVYMASPKNWRNFLR